MEAAATYPLRFCHVRTSNLGAQLVEKTGLLCLYLTIGSSVS